MKSRAEAVEWAKRVPNPYEQDGELEVRQFFELEDFAPSKAVDRAKELGKESKIQEAIALRMSISMLVV